MAAPDRPDPVALLQAQDAVRTATLLPVRHGRMDADEFAFYRGAAAIMAADLAVLPRSGLEVQLCGDAHVSNFGVYASPERSLVFDLNDFDEALRGPFEWDVLRLVASLEIAARANGFSPEDRANVVLGAVRAYRSAMATFAESGLLETWYARMDVDAVMAEFTARASKSVRRNAEDEVRRARGRTNLRTLKKLTEVVDGRLRIRDDPPLLVPMSSVFTEADLPAVLAAMTAMYEQYRASLPDDRRHLLEGYELVDIAHKVVGVGSVGTRAFVLLLVGRGDADPLFLQMKEANASVLEEHLAPSPYDHHGRRVVEGQRMMQAASDLFLGWNDGTEGRHYYWRQLRDMKGSADLSVMSARSLTIHARLCGWTLARAHARSGSPVAIDAYLGSKDTFDRAMVAFASAYADQNRRDFETHRAAIAEGRLEARSDL